MDFIIEFLDDLDNITPVQMTDCFYLGSQDLYTSNQYSNLDISQSQEVGQEVSQEVNSHEDISIYLV